MIAQRMHRATLALGAAALVSCLFALTPVLGAALDFVQVRGAGIVALAVFGALAVVSALTKVRALGLIAGAGLLLCALLQLVQLGQSLNLLGGDASTVSLFGGLGIGLVSIWLAARAVDRNPEGTPLT
ncbi:MAG: hypothetical protein WBL06_08035 [Pseudolysinimonas sp.]|jgi:hypothetical protein|uniref:Rv1678 family membrane protein n=1 Tax=Pseudolysinimonas sp. TaxID=2680009 RepID=UPI003C72CA59